MLNQTNPGRKILFIILPIVIIGLASYIAWSKYYSPKKESGQSSNQLVPADSKDGSAVNSPVQESGEANLSQEESGDIEPFLEKRSEEKPDEAIRQNIIQYFNQNLNNLVPSPKNDKWDVPTFYFVGNTHFYVELYAEETDLAGFELLYQVDKSGSEIKLTELARYKEDSEDWTLIQGKDDFKDYVMEEYDYNEKNKKWEKTDEFSDEEYLDESSGEDDITGDSLSAPIIP